MANPLTRVQQLIELAVSSGEHEARTAALKACLLIKAHGLVLVHAAVDGSARAAEEHIRGSSAQTPRASRKAPRNSKRDSPEPSTANGGFDVARIVNRAAGSITRDVLREMDPGSVVSNVLRDLVRGRR